MQHSPPEEIPNPEGQELRPTPVKTLYGFAVDLAEVPQLLEYDTAVAVEVSQDAHRECDNRRGNDCEVTLDPTSDMIDMEVEEGSGANTAAQCKSTETAGRLDQPLLRQRTGQDVRCDGFRTRPRVQSELIRTSPTRQKELLFVYILLWIV